MADWVTISSLATAGGTLVLAAATFSSVKSANRAARIAERSMLVGVRPILIPSREKDPTERVAFGEGHRVTLHGHGGVIEPANGNIYMAIGLRNAGSGVAVLHGWHVDYYEPGMPHEMPDPDSFRRQQLDLYIPSGEVGHWQGAIRDTVDPDYERLVAAVEADGRVTIDLIYGDHEGGQRTIVRFGVTMDEEGTARSANVVRYWNLDADDPRERDDSPPPGLAPPDPA
jgi:hypothetical protein